MIATKELSGYLDEYLEEKQEIKNLTSETIKNKHLILISLSITLKMKELKNWTAQMLKQLRHYRRYCLKGRGNKRTTVKTYMMNILEFINSEEVQEEIQHDPIKMKDIIEVKVEDPETAKKNWKISLNSQQSDFLLETIELSGNARDYAICSTFLDSGIRLKELVGLNKSDIQVPLDENGFYILPDDVNSYIELHLRAETTKDNLKTALHL